MINYKPVPHSIEAEKCVIGSILIDADAFRVAIEKLKPTDFYDTKNALIFKMFVDMASDNVAIDATTLVEHAKKTEEISKIGGASYLSDCVVTVPTSTNISSYVRFVLEASVRRRGLSMASELSQRMLNENMKLTELYYEFDTKLAEMSRLTNKKDTGSLEVAKEEYERRKADKHRMFTGISGVDSITKGLRSGTMWILGASSGAGKSFFALEFALRQALNGFNVLFFSTELGKAENLRRIANIATQHMNLNFDDSMAEIVKMSNFKLYTELLGINEILSEIKFRNRLKKVDLVVIDHLHDISYDPKLKQYEGLTNAVERILETTKAENVGTLLVSQLSRGAVKQGDQTETAFLGTGKIEQVAHCAFLLSRVKDDNGHFTPEIKIAVVKNRDGQQGTIEARFNIPYMNILEVENIGQEKLLGDILV